MQLNLQLVRVSDGVPVWGENIHVPSSELARLEDHPFVENIIDALRVQITAMEHERLFRAQPANQIAGLQVLSRRALGSRAPHRAGDAQRRAEFPGGHRS